MGCKFKIKAQPFLLHILVECNLFSCIIATKLLQHDVFIVLEIAD